MRDASARRRRCGVSALALIALSSARPVYAQALLTSAVQIPSASQTPTGVDAGRGATVVSGGLGLDGPPRNDLKLSAAVKVQAGDAADATAGWAGAAAAPNAQTPWSRVNLDLGAVWAAAPGATVRLDAGRAMALQSVLAPGQPQPVQNTHDDTFANAAVTVQPASPVTLSLGSQVRQADDTVQDPAGRLGDAHLSTSQTDAEAKAQWTPAPGLDLQASGAVSYADLNWRDHDAARQSYAVAQPAVAAELTPWDGGHWSLSFGHAVTALDPATFVAVAQGLQRAGTARASTDLAPNQEWRTRASFSQALGSGQIIVSVTQARLDTTTELTRNLGGVDAPGIISGGAREQVDVALALPLSPLGLNGVSLETGGAMRRSEVVDPLTGSTRRLSGETPYDAHLTLAQDISPWALRWGVQANALGPQVTYTPEVATTAAQTRTLGLFVEYRPQIFALRLQMDGLAGGDRSYTDAVYTGSRDTGRITRLDHRVDDATRFTLMLRKAL